MTEIREFSLNSNLWTLRVDGVCRAKHHQAAGIDFHSALSDLLEHRHVLGENLAEGLPGRSPNAHQLEGPLSHSNCEEM